MPKVSKTATLPSNLKPFQFHGVNVNWGGSGSGRSSDEATADCPFCAGEGKFSILAETGQWRCLKCNIGPETGKKGGFKGGNVLTFLRLLWERSKEYTTDEALNELANERALLGTEGLVAWGVVQSYITGDWLFPSYSAGNKICNLYRYCKGDKGKNVLKCTASVGHWIHGVNLYNPKKKYVYLCEGPWDAIALWEVLRGIRKDEENPGNFIVTANENRSLFHDANILAVPGCGVFFDSWLKYFGKKHVVLLYDNDHPGKNRLTGEALPPAALEAMERVTQLFVTAEEKPTEVKYMQWGPQGYNTDLKSGMDVRDILKEEGDTLDNRVHGYYRISQTLQPIPNEWVVGSVAHASKDHEKNGSVKLQPVPCDKWSTLIMSWRKAMKWTDGLDRALSFMMACILSTKQAGDQLWGKVIGPPACGKTTLCEALSVNEKYILAKSHIRGFHSGFKSDRSGEEDNSLVAKLFDKTLITKDGDTLLQSPNLGQILGEARDIYDRVARTHYRNKMGKDYTGVNLTWILCGTSSLRALDSSELGERFLDCVIVDEIDEEVEEEIGRRVAYQAERDLTFESNGRPETSDSPDRIKAKQLTGGYVSYLRENAGRLLREVTFEDDALVRCQRLGKFVAYMRARPSTKHDEKAEREMSFRLISQFVRLAKCMAVVLNKRHVDDEVMRRVTRSAMDTSRGRTLEICQRLYSMGEKGGSIAGVALMIHSTSSKVRNLLWFLREIGAVESFTPDSPGVSNKTQRWRLTSKMTKLYRQVTSAIQDD